MEAQPVAHSEQPDSPLHDTILAHLDRVLQRLRQGGIPFCILRNRQRIPSTLLTGSDVDLVLPAGASQARLMRLLADLRPVHVAAHRAAMEVFFQAGPIFLHVDLLVADREWRGACYLKNEDILRDRWDDEGLPVASRLHQAFCAWFSSLTRRRLFKARYVTLIREVAGESPAMLQTLVHGAFGRRLGEALLELARQDRLTESESLAGRCRRTIWRRALLRRPLATLGGAVSHYWHEARQYWRPSGVSVAIVGPDGAGKSAVCAALAACSRAELPFRQIETHHLYPRVLPMLSELRKGRLRRRPAAPAAVHDPHGKRPHSAAVSLFTLAWHTIDQWLSRWRWALPKLSKNTLLIHDRHLLEIMVDPKRFRYGGPRWLAQRIMRLVPQPDLVILLDAPPEALQSRKQEVPFAETARQRQAYRAVVHALPQGRVVDAAQPVEQVVADVKQTIVDFLARRTARRWRLEEDR